MSGQHPPATASASPTSGTTLLTALRWIATVIAVGIVVQALLASQGFYEGKPGLITGHGHLGNALFLLAAILTVIAFIAAARSLVGRNVAVLAVAVTLFMIAQIGLGYTGRTEATAMAWHLPNGVLLMGLATMLAVTLWNGNTGVDRS
jgi:hypothetical protein